jgi:hypothetical protein
LTPISRRRVLGRAKMLDFLGGLAGTPAAGARSLYLPSRPPPAELEDGLKELSVPEDISPELTKFAVSSPNGSVLFWGPRDGYLVLPAFPVRERALFPGFAAGPLISRLQPDYVVALILVRLGTYAIGISQGENLLSRKTGTGLVHGRHRQGGSSAHRFERHRDKQIEYFLTRVCQHIREQLEPQIKTLDYVVYGGAWTTIQLLQKHCPFLGRLGTPALPPLLDIPEPGRAVLETAVKRVWSSTVVEWNEARESLKVP